MNHPAVQDMLKRLKKQLQENLLSVHIHSDLTNTFTDIDFCIYVKEITPQTYLELIVIMDEIGEKHNILLDPFLHDEAELSGRHIDPYGNELVKSQCTIIYGKQYTHPNCFTKEEIGQARLRYIKGVEDKFRRFIKNIKRQQSDWIVEWALDHLFCSVKAYNSLYGFYTLGKKRNISEHAKTGSERLNDVEQLYSIAKSGKSFSREEARKFLAEAYALSHELNKRVMSSSFS